MTEATPSHLDLDALADVLAGEAGPVEVTHLDGCTSCSSRLAELESAEARVVAVLGALPPPPVPDDLAARLSAALAQEAPPGRANVTALPAAAARRRNWLPAAAAAVLLVSGGGLGFALLSDPGGSESGDASTAADAGPALPLSATGTDYADAAAVQAALPTVLAGTGDTRQLRAAAQGRSEDSAAEADAPAETGGGTGASTQPPAPAAAYAGDPLARLRTTDGLADCLAALLPADEPSTSPLGLDYATYSGSPALAVVLPDPDPTKLSVFVVGPECSQADDSTLHFVRVDAP